MAPGNESCPRLPAPFVNHDLMAQPRFSNRLVRVPCTLDSVHDVTTATVRTTDGWELNVNLTTAFKKRADGTFSPVEFPTGEKSYVLEGIVKNDGWWLMLMKQPEVIGKCDMRFVNRIIEFACDEDWLDSLGSIPADPRLELGYTGGRKPDILQLVTYDGTLSDKNAAVTRSTTAGKRKPASNDSSTVSDMSTLTPGSITADDSPGSGVAGGSSLHSSPL